MGVHTNGKSEVKVAIAHTEWGLCLESPVLLIKFFPMEKRHSLIEMCIHTVRRLRGSLLGCPPLSSQVSPKAKFWMDLVWVCLAAPV